MAKSETAVSFNLPKGKLHFVVINGQPYENSAGKEKWRASVLLEEEQARPVIEKIDAFWAEHGFKCKEPLLGYRPYTEHKGNFDEDGEKLYEPVEGVWEFYAATGATWPDGSVREVIIKNSKNRIVSIGDRKIGNGSEGRLSVTMDKYGPFGKGANATGGVALYLQGIQLTKFVEYVSGPEFEEEDDGFDDFEDDGCNFEEETTTTAKPRI